jgi:MFS family permease
MWVYYQQHGMHASGNPVSPSPRSGLATFQALQHRDFRLLWSALAVSAVGTWMQIVATSLLVLELTHGSAVALGTVALAQALSFLIFTPWGGSAADRFDRRRLLLLTQSFLMLLAVLLGTLAATGRIRFWMILLVAFASSAALSFDQPTRNALVASLVPKENLMNAVSLQAAVFNGASILGPALAGLTLSRMGYAGNFFLNAASYLAVLTVLLLLPAAAGQGVKSSGRLLDSVREALRYVRRDAVLPSVVSAYAALMFFGPSTALMLPYFTRQVLHTGPTGLGMLFSAVGSGTVVGALVVASIGDFRHKVPLVFGAVLLWTVALGLFGGSGSLVVSILALFVLGAAQNAAGATTITLLQTRVPPEMRGRAMSLNTLLVMCLRPLGDLPASVMLSRLGFRPAVILSAAIVAVVLLTLSARAAVRGVYFRTPA